MSDDPLNDLAMANQTPRVVRPRRVVQQPLAPQPMVVQLAQPAKPFHTGFMVTLGVLAALFVVWLGIVIYTMISARVALEVIRANAAAAHARAVETQQAQAAAQQQARADAAKAEQARINAALARAASQRPTPIPPVSTPGNNTPSPTPVVAPPIKPKPALTADALKFEGTFVHDNAVFMRVTNVSLRPIKEAIFDVRPTFAATTSMSGTVTGLGPGQSMEMQLSNDFQGVTSIQRLVTITSITARD